MHVMYRLPPLLGVLLLGAAQYACAEGTLPDPVAPAVVGRPIHQIRPARAAHPKTTTAAPKTTTAPPKTATSQPKRARQAAATGKDDPPRPPAPVAIAPAPAPTPVQAAPVAQQTVQSPVVPPAQVVGNVGSSTHLVSSPARRGGYFSSDDELLVRRYYAAHPLSAQPAQWKIGEPIPPRAELTGVPDDVRAALPALPPGHQYVQVDGDVVLVALPSRVVIDGIGRTMR